MNVGIIIYFAKRNIIEISDLVTYLRSVRNSGLSKVLKHDRLWDKATILLLLTMDIQQVNREESTYSFVLLVLLLAVASHVLEQVGAGVHHLHVKTGQLLHKPLPHCPEWAECTAQTNLSIICLCQMIVQCYEDTADVKLCYIKGTKPELLI